MERNTNVFDWPMKVSIRSVMSQRIRYSNYKSFTSIAWESCANGDFDKTIGAPVLEQTTQLKCFTD